MPEEFERVYKALGLGPFYVRVYENEQLIYSCLVKIIFPDNTAEEIKNLDDEFLCLAEGERQAFIDEFSGFVDGFDIDRFIPRTEGEITAAKIYFESLSDEDKKKPYNTWESQVSSTIFSLRYLG